MLRNLFKNTQRTYLATASELAKHYIQSLGQVTKEMMKDYFLYLEQHKGHALTIVGGVITGRKLPTVLSQEQINKILMPQGTSNTASF